MSSSTGPKSPVYRNRQAARGLFQKRPDTVGELKTGCKTGRESTILSRPKALIRAIGGFANSIRTPFGHPSSSSENGLFWG